LTSSAATEQTQMHDIAMNIDDASFQHAMQDTACLIGMFGNILIALQDDFKTAQQCIIVVAVVVYRIHAIGRVM